MLPVIKHKTTLKKRDPIVIFSLKEGDGCVTVQADDEEGRTWNVLILSQDGVYRCKSILESSGIPVQDGRIKITEEW